MQKYLHLHIICVMQHKIHGFTRKNLPILASSFSLSLFCICIRQKLLQLRILYKPNWASHKVHIPLNPHIRQFGNTGLDFNRFHFIYGGISIFCFVHTHNYRK